MNDNALTLTLEAASRHMDNPAVKALADKLDTARKMASLNASTVDMMAGWRRGAAGEHRFGLMHSLDASALSPMLREMGALHKIAIVTDCLATVLRALGEQLDY